MCAKINENNDVGKNNSSHDIDDDNFSYNKQGPAHKGTASSKHLVVHDEDSSIRIGGEIHSRLNGAALEPQVIQSPLVRFSQDQSIIIFWVFIFRFLIFLYSCHVLMYYR